MPHRFPRLVARIRLGGPTLALLLVATTVQTAPPPLVDVRGRHTGPHLTDLAIPSIAATVARSYVRPAHGGHEHRGRWFQVARLDAATTAGFRMVGVTWRPGTTSPDVEVRVRTDRGWGRWTTLEPDEDGPGPREHSPSTRAGTQALWVGAGEGIRVRVLSRRRTAPADLEVNLIDPGKGPGIQPVNTRMAPRPGIISRRQWGANPKYRTGCWKPIHGRTQHGVVIHHTAGTNSYTRSQSDDLVRGIYHYHTQSRGWCDLGYNFLVSRYGQIYEGRAGGIWHQVRGAHAGVSAVNKLMTGVSLMGNFERARPTSAMRGATVRLVAWRLESFYRNPHGRVTIGGVTYPRIAGHRNVKATACPGRYVYSWLPQLRDRVDERIGAWRSNIYRLWQRTGGSSGWTGAQFRGEHRHSDGSSAVFTRARMYSSPAGTHEVHGPILRAYASQGWADGRLGYPKTNVRRITAGKRSNFQGGCIIWYRSTGKTRIFYRS